MASEFLLDHIILKVEVGSTAHGTGIPGHEDQDEMAVAVEPLKYTLGLERAETYTHRPGRGPGDPSGPGDLDLVVYPLQKFMSLALSANPAIMMVFWSNVLTSTHLGNDLRDSFDKFVSKRLFNTHLGYAKSQINRMKDGKYYKSRAKIVETFGYDTKYAMHALRLLLQGLELAETGKIQIPIPNPNGDLLREIRHGKYKQEDFFKLYEHYEEKLREEEQKSTLPEEPNRDWANQFLIEVYTNYWYI